MFEFSKIFKFSKCWNFQKCSNFQNVRIFKNVQNFSFRDRDERRQWLNCLHDHTLTRPKLAKRALPVHNDPPVSPVASRIRRSTLFPRSEKASNRRQSAISFVSTAISKIHQKTQNVVKKRISIV